MTVAKRINILLSSKNWWWDGLTRVEQEKYIKDHPHTKLRVNKVKTSDIKGNTFVQRKLIKDSDLHSSYKAKMRLQTLSKNIRLSDIAYGLFSWFNGDLMGVTDKKVESISRNVKIMQAFRKAYPPKVPKRSYRSTLLKVGNMSNEKLEKMSSFIPGDKQITSWTSNPKVALKFFNSVHKSTNRGKTNGYAWVILEGDMHNYAAVDVNSARQFYVDMIKNHKHLLESGMINPKNEDEIWTEKYLLKSALKEISSSFIQSQQENVCITPKGKKVPCRIFKILRRGNMVKQSSFG